MARTIWRPVVIAAGVGVVILVWINRGPGSISTVESAVPDGPVQPHPTSVLNRQSPFLASHESRAVDRPDATDVAPSFHIELERLKTYVSEHPGDIDARLRLAQMLQDGHQEEAAIAEYRAYLKQVPSSRAAWLDLATTYATRGEWLEALAASDSVLALYPGDPSGLYNKGAVLANLGRIAEARAIWLQAQAQNEDEEIRRMAQLALARLEK